jgi:hypothetical protein
MGNATQVMVIDAVVQTTLYLSPVVRQMDAKMLSLMPALTSILRR